MKRDRVARRFEIQAVSHEALAEIVRHMNKAKEALASDFETTTLDTSDVDPIPMMSVRVTGPSSAVAKIRASVSPGRSVKVLRDWLEVLPGASRPDEDYPDRRTLLRIDPEGRSRDVVGNGERVVVAIVDSGLAVRHPALEAHVWTENVNGRKIHGARRMGKGAEDYDVTDQDGDRKSVV